MRDESQDSHPPRFHHLSGARDPSCRDVGCWVGALAPSWFIVDFPMNLRGVPEHSAGVSQKDHQAPIGILTCCEIRCLHAQTCRRVKLGPRTPTPATDLLPDVPVGSFAVEGKNFQAPIGIGSHNGSSTQLYIGWVSQRSQGP